MALPDLKALRSAIHELWSAYNSITRAARTAASRARIIAKAYQHRLATYLGLSEEFTSERFYAILLALSPLLVVQVILALLDCLGGSTEAHSLLNINTDDSPIVQESHRALYARRKSVFELVFAYARGFSTDKARSLVVPNQLYVNDTFWTIVCCRLRK